MKRFETIVKKKVFFREGCDVTLEGSMSIKTLSYYSGTCSFPDSPLSCKSWSRAATWTRVVVQRGKVSNHRVEMSTLSTVRRRGCKVSVHSVERDQLVLSQIFSSSVSFLSNCLILDLYIHTFVSLRAFPYYPIITQGSVVQTFSVEYIFYLDHDMVA